MKRIVALRVSTCCLAVLLLLTTASVCAQTIAYRTNGLAADSPGAPHISPALLNPWGIAFLHGGNFFIAENASGRVDSYDAAGNLGAGVVIPAPPGSTASFSSPTGIAAVTEPNVGPIGADFQFLVAADNGTIWGFSVANGAPATATRFVDNSSTSASYTGIAFVHPDCCSAYIAVANFAEGEVDTFTRRGDPLSLAPLIPNPFIDPNLPEGFAPFNIQLIGNQIFVTYALQRSDHKPLLDGSGGGMVNIFDTDGNFVKRFVSPGDVLNAPWGITQASANFGPFSNDILIANDGGDGSISAFDPVSGEFVDQLAGASGFLSFVGIHGMAFRSDNVGDPNALYEVDASAEGQTPHGSFDTITTAVASRVFLNFLDTTLGAAAVPGDPITLTAGVPDNATGTIVFLDTCCTLLSPPLTQTTLGTADLVNGTASITTTFLAGDHRITASYSGDANFAPGSTTAILPVLFETRTTLSAPSSVASGMPVQVSANIDSNPAVQPRAITGDVTFSDGTTTLGTVALNNMAAAELTLSSLSPGTHTIVAEYSGSRFFQGGRSAAATVTVTNPIPGITSLTPFSAKQNSSAFTLTVNGSGFVTGAVVNFNGSPRPTTLVSSTQLTAAISGADLASSGTAAVTVANPAPGGGNSGIAMFAIDTATATSVTLQSGTLTVTAGQSVSVKAQPTGFSGALTVMCLNAPEGVTCAFDQSNSSVNIQTTAATPKGSHPITVVFTAEALASSVFSPSPQAEDSLLGCSHLGISAADVRMRRLRLTNHFVKPDTPHASGAGLCSCDVDCAVTWPSRLLGGGPEPGARSCPVLVLLFRLSS